MNETDVKSSVKQEVSSVPIRFERRSSLAAANHKMAAGESAGGRWSLTQSYQPVYVVG